MLGKHRATFTHACDTEALEDALEAACGGNLQITHRLELRRLAIALWYDAETKKQGTNMAARPVGVTKSKSIEAVPMRF